MNTKPLLCGKSSCPESGASAMQRQRTKRSRLGDLRFLLLVAVAVFVLAPLAHTQTNWVLVWSDEFNGPAGPFTPTSSNNQFWTFETGQGVFGTGEIEDMISDGTTSFLDGNGHLVIKTYLSGSTYFSARIKTQLNGSFGKEFTYGRVEARIQIPTSQAIWPAFWMMGDNGVTWPGRGEIDIMENNGAKPTQVKGTIHGIGYANTGLGVDFHSPDGSAFASAYHTYGMIWSPFQIQFYVDDPSNIYATMTPGAVMGVGANGTTSTLGQWDFWGHPFFILFDVAVGGGFVGPPGSGTVVPQMMNIDYVRLYQATPPAGPTSLTATPVSNSQVQLNWTASTTSDTNIRYNIFRSTTSGTEHNISNTNMANMIATGVTGTSFTDVMLTPGTTYFYEVNATSQASGESPLSNEAVASQPSSGTGVQAIAISSGSLVGTNNFVQDTGFSGGATNAYPDVIDVSGVANPAPQSVYRSERWAPFTYTIPNLTPGASSTVRLHFAETAFSGAGQRAFNVAINGTQVLTNYDIFADAGAQFKATEKTFTSTADSSGKITVAFTAGTNGAPHTNPSVRGIEIIPQGCSAPTTPGSFTATAVSSSEIDLSWSASSGAACGGTITYKVTRNGTQVSSGLSGTTLKDTGLTASTTYTYTVTAVNSAGSSAAATTSATTPAACSVPTTPTNFAATAVSTSEIDLSWTAATGPSCGGAVTYNVTRNGAQIATGQSTTSLKDTGLTASTTYSYTVAAVNSVGASTTASASATTQGGTTTVVQVNAGGPAVSPFVADVDFSGGGTIHHSNTIDLSAVTNPAPMAVYQTGRDGNFTYTVPSFTAGSSHTVRLHFAETFWTSAGLRIFNVTINGTRVLTNFDIFATAGAMNKAVIEQFTASANANGQIVIQFTTVKDNSLVNGIEIR
ncbi:MAG TPA: malectin domain-containing carbohydrate-binding protein [Candidatus Angelobacter sp.]|nr:malectin domain-containing carbohydrate-binding protein [Candidatus Angelobacter sp.]